MRRRHRSGPRRQGCTGRRHRLPPRFSAGGAGRSGPMRRAEGPDGAWAAGGLGGWTAAGSPLLAKRARPPPVASLPEKSSCRRSGVGPAPVLPSDCMAEEGVELADVRAHQRRGQKVGMVAGDGLVEQLLELPEITLGVAPELLVLLELEIGRAHV